MADNNDKADLTKDDENSKQNESSDEKGSFKYQSMDGRKGQRRNTIDLFCTVVDHDLLIAKTFYFFFFSAFGSLLPLIAVYFKQLGMNPSQSGVLVGFRPFVEFCSAPLWGGFADRFQKGKILLLFSLFCWIAFTLAIAFIQPAAASCVKSNSTHQILEDAYIPREKRWMKSEDGLKILQVHSSKMQPIGKAPYKLESTKIINYNKSNKNLVKPPISTVVYDKNDVQEVFLILLLLIIIGEFFSAPAITLADSATLGFLGADSDNYGKQRMFGSLGWGLAMFFIGIALDHATTIPQHPCGGQDMKERNYTLCFAVFSVLMGCAFITATQFNFTYNHHHPEISMNDLPVGKIATVPPLETADDLKKNEKTLGPLRFALPAGIPQGTAPGEEEPSLPKWITVLKTFCTIRYGLFLFITWFMGFGIGLVFAFLFWHLQDLGGSPTLFGVASVINHISEIFAYFFSSKLIGSIGHIHVLYIGLAGNVARFVYISWLWDPWWVMPFEFIQGITHALVWAACCSYVAQATPQNLRSSAQGILQGLHHGLGRGCGAIIGGIMVHHFGTQITFRAYGFACLFILVLFALINHFVHERGQSSLNSNEPHQILEESSHLAPHGLLTSPVIMSLSNSKLNDKDPIGDINAPYGTYGSTNENFSKDPNTLNLGKSQFY